MPKTGRTDKYNKDRKVAVTGFLASVSIQHPKSLNKNGDIKWEKTISVTPKEHSDGRRKVQRRAGSGRGWEDLQISAPSRGTARSRMAKRGARMPARKCCAPCPTAVGLLTAWRLAGTVTLSLSCVVPAVLLWHCQLSPFPGRLHCLTA